MLQSVLAKLALQSVLAKLVLQSVLAKLVLQSILAFFIAFSSLFGYLQTFRMLPTRLGGIFPRQGRGGASPFPGTGVGN